MDHTPFEKYTPNSAKKNISKVSSALKWLESSIESGEDFAEYNVNIHVHNGEVRTIEKTVKIRER